MCGITAGVAERDVAPILIDGLKRLEYRGYDSAGVALLTPANTLLRMRIAGKVQQLSEAMVQDPIAGKVGIAHTRWATHGKPSEENAHPHVSGDNIALVHNGIIENYATLKRALIEKGFVFSSQTDTEVIVHCLSDFMRQGHDLLAAVQATVKLLEGAYALAVISKETPDRVVVARVGSPLVIGMGIGEHFVASDPLALLPLTQDFVYLEEGDVGQIFVDRFEIYDEKGERVNRAQRTIQLTADHAGRGTFRHFMQKEIFEQPRALQATLAGRLNDESIQDDIFGAKASVIFDQTKQIQIVGCGTSLHAGLIARHWFETFAGIPCVVDPASELRYMEKKVVPGTLLVAISQSGETADTLAAVRHGEQEPYSGRLSICNVPESALIRESDLSFLIQAGPEIGVASTKTFTATLTALLLLLGCLGRRHHFSDEKEIELIEALKQIPLQVEGLLKLDAAIQSWAKHFHDKQHALYLGRGAYYPVALEGALKLKEISYIHAEAYPAGELKHGPLALVDKDMPVVVVIANNKLQDKLKSNLQEVRARGGELFVFAEKGVELEPDPHTHVIVLPQGSPFTSPILCSLPLQLLSYHVAVLKGTDVDQPRNLAKSVTVE
ncbi:MAG: glutamine--fructose-6-phosphate transaminase (isomerizing) [Gammaproteobacteria bacterium]